MIVEKKWSYLQWLWKHDRTLSLPALVFASVAFGGLYYCPWDCREEIAGLDVDRSKGIIVVSPLYSGSIAATLAHEWRHHFQWHNGLNIRSPAWNLSDKGYEAQIKRYFTSSKTEMDALLFEHRMAPCDLNAEWIDILAV